MFEKAKEFFGTQDMTAGSPVMAIARLALPLLVGSFVWQLYSVVDSAVLEKYCTIERNGYNSMDALSAVGASSSIINLLPVLFIAIAAGTGILAAQYFGAKEKEKLSACMGTSLALAVAVAAVIVAVGIPVARPLLVLLETPENYLGLAAAYLQITFLGFFGIAIFYIVSGILLGLGGGFYPLVCLLVSTAMNCGLDIWFVAELGWGVQGAAWATTISQTVSAILCMIGLICMKDAVGIRKKTMAPKLDAVGWILKLGLPIGVAWAALSLTDIFAQGLAKRMGGVVTAAHVTIMKMDGFVVLPAFALGLAVSAYIGQNLGAKKTERLEPGEKAALMPAMGVYVVIVPALFLFGKQLIGIFFDFLNQTNNSAYVYRDMVDLGGRELKILAIGYIAMCIMQIYGGILCAAGDTVSMMVIFLITTVVVRVPFLYMLAYFNAPQEWPNGHPDALFISLLVSRLLGALLMYLRYRQGKWKNINLAGERQLPL